MNGDDTGTPARLEPDYARAARNYPTRLQRCWLLLDDAATQCEHRLTHETAQARHFIRKAQKEIDWFLQEAEAAREGKRGGEGVHEETSGDAQVADG